MPSPENFDGHERAWNEERIGLRDVDDPNMPDRLN